MRRRRRGSFGLTRRFAWRPLSELLLATGSDSFAVTVAVLPMLPAWVGVTTIVTVAEAPLLNDPKLQMTVVVPVQLP